MSASPPPNTVCAMPDRAVRLSIDALLPYVPTSAGRVLDCTGEWGGRGHALKAHGVREVVGLVDETAGKPGGDEGYDHQIQGRLDFTPIPFEAGSFDCMVFSHVLERLRNPDAFLKPLLPCLKSEGIVVLAAPNIGYHRTVLSLAEGRWSYGDQGVWDRKNLRFFTAFELRWLFQRLGFTYVRFASLVWDDASVLPRDDEGFIQRGDIRIGPLSDEQYAAWLTEYYLVLATRR